MKILAIRGKNLASLEGAFEIDFTSEPLRSAGIFAITGPTGAGKSTILDALCLALFDNAPRLNKAELLKIEDENQDNITLKDCRNILRKGTADGLAEVDFVALNGDKYRSQWTVRRARGKANGALQNTFIRLENLSTSSEEQGTKRDLLNRITQIIGLTFDQFTRAVLLAQGDFATFLKAKQNEKAELLEKLTGTDIYSKISTLIYERAGEAKTTLDILKQRIADVRLLTDDELAAFNQEKDTLSEQSEPIKQKFTRIEQNVNWLKQEEQLKQEITQADHELKNIQSKIHEAAPRYEYMAMLDLSQEIRDSYIDLENKQKQQTRLNANLQKKTEEKKRIDENLIRIETDLKTVKSQLDELEQKYTTLKPKITKAKELDIQIKTVAEKKADIQKELESLQKQLKQSEQNLSALQTQLQKAGETKDTLKKWYADNEPYKEIVPRIDLIISLLDTAKTATDQQQNISKSLESGQKMLQTYHKQLKQLEEDAERLNSLLPAEILNLREKLEEGKPCPVCGSIHHPLDICTDQQNSVNEKELESAKKKTTEAITTAKQAIENTQKSITTFEVHLKTFQSQIERGITGLKQYLSPLPDWETKLNQNTLQNKLSEITRLWNENKIKAEMTTQQIETLSVRIEAEDNNLSKIKEEQAKKTEMFAEQTKLLNNHTDERYALLGNNSVDNIENKYTSLKTAYTQKYEQQRTEKEKADSEKASVNGTITQLQKDMHMNAEQTQQLVSAIKDWLNNSKHPITSELLKELMSKSREWIAQEKNYLNDIKNQELILSTKLNERITRLAKHQESEHKPDKELTKESLELQLTELSGKQEIINKRLTEIQVALITHEQGKQRIKTFESELNTKEELHNNWAKLNDLLGSASGNKFKTIAQGYTLDVLLDYANKHLADLTKRYQLEKIPNTLALQVIDNDMLGEVRTVHSLSGGESFLISLSLALGLSSLSSNRMKIESLFIDEGFGSLDIDTLSVAMDALDNLQTQGRKIGVISHVEEMKERISARIQVNKEANGRSSVKIIG